MLSDQDVKKLTDKMLQEPGFREEVLKDPRTAAAKLGIKLDDAEHKHILGQADAVREQARQWEKMTPQMRMGEHLFFPIFGILKPGGPRPKPLQDPK